MARIRTIKPEFPHSESMGKISRNARLTFILLWTIADDSGRLRGNSRMLASLLFPYDDDAIKQIDNWLEELVSQCCIIRYEHEGSQYIQIENWLSHQRIDKPSASKIPEFQESSRILANPPEAFLVGKEGNGKEGNGNSYTPEFELFWMKYPDTRKGNKHKAFIKWKAALNEATIEEIMNGLEAYIGSSEVSAGYAKQADGWLHNCKWRDRYKPAGAILQQKQPQPKRKLTSEFSYSNVGII